MSTVFSKTPHVVDRSQNNYIYKKLFCMSRILKKGSKLYSILYLKCPQCQEGDLFIGKNPYNAKEFDKMPHYCPVCHEDFERETGFYWGAMMVSHATTTLIAVIVHIIAHIFYGWEILPNIIAFIGVFAVLLPIIFRSSRAIWINIFVKYHSRN